jgi:hypothetical protein
MSALFSFHDPSPAQLRESAALLRAYGERIKRAASIRDLAALEIEIEALPRGLRAPLLVRLRRRAQEVP